MQIFITILLVGLTLLTVSCDPNDAGCVSDAECYNARTCQDGQCQNIPVINPNNVPGNNGENNGFNNGENNFNNGENNFNNGENNFNNGENNFNNGENNEGCDCPGDSICRDGECRQLCESSFDCADEEACTGGVERAPVCEDTQRCVIEAFELGAEGCNATFSCIDALYETQCVFFDNRIECSCSSSTGEDVDLIVVANDNALDVCSDITQIQDIANLNCGGRIRIRNIDG